MVKFSSPESIITVNSCSGGKTSSCMYLDFPTDETIFAVVLSNHKVNRLKDKGVLREVQNRIPWFEGTMEVEQTLTAMLELEQLGGRKITWVASDWTYEDLVMGQTNIPGKQMPALPNGVQRFCTQWLKLYPIFYHCYNFWLPRGQILMNIGFRFDEPKRVKKYDGGCKLNRITFADKCDITGRFKGKHRWVKDFWWRDIQFPMYYAGIKKADVNKRIAETGIIYPEISNCAYCFFHKAEEHRRQYELNPEQAEAWIDLEDKVSFYHGKDITFDKRYRLEEVLFKGVNNNPGVSGCMCTD
jgi:hypothetical protein